MLNKIKYKEFFLMMGFILCVGIFQYKADKKKYYKYDYKQENNIEEAIDIIHHTFVGSYSKDIVRESLKLLFNKYDIKKNSENYLTISNKLVDYRKLSKGKVREMDIINDILLMPKIDTILLDEVIKLSYKKFSEN